MSTITRHLLAALIGSAVLGGLGAAHATDWPADDDRPVEIRATRAPAAIADPSPEALLAAVRHLDSHYRMTTGRLLHVVADGGTLLMRYGTRREQMLHFDGHGAFVSAGGRFELRFELDAAGQPAVVRLALPAAWL